MRITIFPGETLRSALERGQILVEAPCNGNGTCGGCTVKVYGIGDVRSCKFDKPGIYEVTIPARQQFQAVGTVEHHDFGKGAAAAVDLGTTTVAGVKWTDGKEERFSFTNPQRVYGADVMSRIQAANEGKLEELQQLLAAKLHPYVKDCDQVIFSGNTTMNHLLRGMSCQGLGSFPFQPVDLSFCRTFWEYVKNIKESNCRDTGDAIPEPKKEKLKTQITFLPSISTFVGGDIVSGIYQLRMIQRQKPILLVDLGTNGEMALGNRDRILTASTAAGPAFEGSELAMELHGSGIMKLLHQMRVDEIIDETGMLNDEFFQSGYPVVSGKAMTQETIRQIQMAKGAIHAGVEVLLKTYGILAKDVEKVYLAGGMGYYLDPEDALAIGLLPEEFRGKIQAVGNSSLDGAIRYLTEPESRGDLDKILELSKEIQLANDPAFQEAYIYHMNFPEI